MVGRLITFPLRVGVRGAQLWFRATEEITGRATTGAIRAVSLFTRDGSSDSDPGRARERSQPEREQDDWPRDPRSQATEAPPEEPFTAEYITAPAEQPVEIPEPAREPAHVSEEPELVREEADPGAEDGAGAGVTVQEPWEGYGRMSAKEVIARLTDANSAELAAVALYESGNRSRQTVLEAVQRQMRTANGGGSH